MQAEAPAARGSGEPRSIVAERHQEGGCVVDGGKGRACSRRVSANGTWENGFVHPLDVTFHSVGPGGRSLLLLTGARAGGSGVVVINVAPMGVAVFPIFELLDWGRGEIECARGGISVKPPPLA
jgi:hypothetical protein